MMKKWAMLLAFLLPGLGYQCTDCKFKSSYFDIQSLEFHTGKIVLHQNEDPIVATFDTDTISVGCAEFTLWMPAAVDYYTVRSFTPGNALWACSPPEPGDNGSKERIKTLVITSDQDFDTDHPAGTSLNDLLDVSEVYGTYVSDYYGHRRDLTTWLATAPEPFQHTTFLLKRDVCPVPGIYRRFHLHYEHSDGETFDVETRVALVQ